jgi:trans-AT polyketide synthase/acyltransferase/oxidoreductase domain-containing protein
MTTAVIFPGQGSQRTGMGEGLFDRYPDLERQADSVLGYSVRELCLANPDGRLAQTLYTQPARYTVNALSWRAAVDDGLVADVVLGHSVGEYAALLAAQVFDFATGLRLVLSRARAMAAVPGAMSVVLGLDAERIRQVLLTAGLSVIDLANLNAADQTVIAGPADDVAAAADPLVNAGAFAVRRLEVSGPFHSRYMRRAARVFAREVHGCPLAAPRIPVIANRTAREYPATGMGRLLIEQVDHQVLWAQSLSHILSRDPDVTFVELGGTRTLGGTVRRALRQAGRAS